MLLIGDKKRNLHNYFALARAWSAFLLDTIFPLPDAERALNTWGSSDLLVAPRLIDTHAGVHVYALLPYRHPKTRTLIRALKYHGNQHAAHVCALVLYDFLCELSAEDAPWEKHTPIIVPVPLSSERLRTRGYNQVERILLSLSREHPEWKSFISTGILRRTRHTKPQTQLNRRERLTNVSGAFAVTPAPISKQTPIYLLDDVTTTGATLLAAHTALTQAGFTHVTPLAIAYA